MTTQSPTLRVNITVKRSTYTIGVTTHESLHVGGGLRWRSVLLLLIMPTSGCRVFLQIERE